MPAASNPILPILAIGKATHFTLREDGEWHQWNPSNGRPVSQTGVVFAVKFESGWIWDQLVGWRRSND
jgi:hypothetical protein